MSDIASQIRTILDRGECVQVVGLPGMGISRLGISLGGFLFNINLYLHPEPQQIIADLSAHAAEKLIVFESLDRMLLPELKPVFAYLKALRDQHKYQLKYVFLNHTDRPVPPSHRSLLSDLYSLVSENIVYLLPVPKSNFNSHIRQNFVADLKFNPSAQQLSEIYRLSGGIPALIKIVMQAMRDQKPADFNSNPRLKAQLEEMREVMDNHPRDYGSQLLKDYLSQYSPPSLSATETKLFNLLKNSVGQIISKDKICEAVYPDVKNRAGISDHSLDQLIHRLKSKIHYQYTIITHRGLGYKLEIL